MQNMYINTCTQVCMFMSVSVHKQICIHTYIGGMYACIYVCVYVQACVCIYIYICIHIYIYMNTHTHPKPYSNYVSCPLFGFRVRCERRAKACGALPTPRCFAWRPLRCGARFRKPPRHPYISRRAKPGPGRGSRV